MAAVIMAAMAGRVFSAAVVRATTATPFGFGYYWGKRENERSGKGAKNKEWAH